MAVRDVEFVIIGGGVAAAKAAEGVRTAGGEGSAVAAPVDPTGASPVGVGGSTGGAVSR